MTSRPLDGVGHLAHRRDVGLDVVGDLGVGAVEEPLGLEAVVVIVDVDRQDAADVGVVHGHARDVQARRHRLALLADDVDLVAQPRQGRGEPGVVDVRARAAKEVAVEDQEAHGRKRWIEFGVAWPFSVTA